ASYVRSSVRACRINVVIVTQSHVGIRIWNSSGRPVHDECAIIDTGRELAGDIVEVPSARRVIELKTDDAERCRTLAVQCSYAPCPGTVPVCRLLTMRIAFRSPVERNPSVLQFTVTPGNYESQGPRIRRARYPHTVQVLEYPRAILIRQLQADGRERRWMPAIDRAMAQITLPTV